MHFVIDYHPIIHGLLFLAREQGKHQIYKSTFNLEPTFPWRGFFIGDYSPDYRLSITLYG
jgi:hypothetical protein